MSVPYDGGCLCGALRYRISREPTNSGYCHCSICRRSTGAPVLAWATIPADGFAMIKGDPAGYPSSEQGLRLFCRDCGTQLLYRDANDPSDIEVNLGSLDDPGAIVPRCHIFDADRISWFDTSDTLPRHRAGGTETEP